MAEAAARVPGIPAPAASSAGPQSGIPTAAEQARNLFLVSREMKKEQALREALNATLVASIGPVASAALREAQVKVGVEARPPKLGALMSALEAALR